MTRDRWVVACLGLFLAATAVYAVGVALERGDPATTHSEAHEETEGAEGSGEGSGEGSVLGLDLEGDTVVAVALVVPVLLVALAWFRPGRPVLLVIGVACVGAAALDAREIGHQIDEHHAVVASVAGFVLLLHVLAAVTSAAAVAARGRAQVSSE